MDDALLVRRLERVAICFAIGSASSSGIAPRAMRCDRSSPSTSSITSAVTSGGLLEPVDRGDVGMVEGRQDFGFALKAREAIGIAGH